MIGIEAISSSRSRSATSTSFEFVPTTHGLTGVDLGGVGPERDPDHRHRADRPAPGWVSAQYGSDAIAGVLNYRLKDASEGISLKVRYSEYLESNDGETLQITGNIGLPLPKSGNRSA